MAKEAAESKARLEQLVTKDKKETKHMRTPNDIRRRQLGNITALLNGNVSKRRKVEDKERSERKRRDASGSDEDRRQRSRHHDDRRDRERREDGQKRDSGTKDLLPSGHRRSSDQRESGRLSRPEEYSSRHRSRSRSRSPRERKSRNSKRRDRSPIHRSRRSPEPEPDDDRRSKRASRRKAPAPPGSDSDPLEAIVGPLPPPKVKSRGRGTVSAASGIDARFSEGYDPALDLSAGDQGEGDDWDMVLDRVKWRQQGADRLRAAGFTDEEIKGWETGKKAEVKWAKSGEGREWDRGKSVVEEDGGGVEWGRLKGT